MQGHALHVQTASRSTALFFPLRIALGRRLTPAVPFFLSRDLPDQATAARCPDLGTALRRSIQAWPQKLRVCLIASGGLSHQIVDENLDRQVVDALVKGEAASLRGLSRSRLNRAPGTPEILNWITVAAAMAPSRMQLVDYLPTYRSLASTGHGLTSVIGHEFLSDAIRDRPGRAEVAQDHALNGGLAPYGGLERPVSQSVSRPARFSRW